MMKEVQRNELDNEEAQEPAATGDIELSAVLSSDNTGGGGELLQEGVVAGVSQGEIDSCNNSQHVVNILHACK